MNVMLSVAVEQGGRSRSVRLVNLSESGSAVIGDLSSEAGAVIVHRERISVRSCVAWTGPNRVGLHFEDPVDVARMLRHVPDAPFAHVAPCRRPGLKVRRPSLAEQQSAEWCAFRLGVSLLDSAT